MPASSLIAKVASSLYLCSPLSQLELPTGYVLYDNDTNKTLEEGQKTGLIVLFLAIFLVFSL